MSLKLIVPSYNGSGLAMEVPTAATTTKVALKLTMENSKENR